MHAETVVFFGVILIPVVGLSTLCSYVVGGMY